MNRYWSNVVKQLVPYVPGEQSKFADLIKLNTNENPYPPSPGVVEAIRRELGEAGESLRRYPDPDAFRLRQAVATYHGIQPEQIFVGNGSDEVLAHVFVAFFKHEQPLLFPDVTYSFFSSYARLYQVGYRTVPLDDAFALHLDDYAEPNGGVLFPNPNAPTGRALPLAQIEQLVARNVESVVVIDEAYVDFGTESAIPLIERYPNLLVVQTVSKSRSLAGMRVGFAFGSKTLIEALNRVKNSFNSYPLDRLAQVATVAAYDDDAWFRIHCSRIMATRKRLTFALQTLGFSVVPSMANFVFARHENCDAGILATRLRARNILVRHFNMPRINQYLRISIGTDAECEALVGALDAVLAAP